MPLKMTSRERVLSACNRKGYDRIPIKHEGTPEINQIIKDHFRLQNDEQMLIVLGDDFRYVEPEYIGPELKTFPDGSIEGYFGERYKYIQFEGGRYPEPVYQPFAGISEIKDLDKSHFPSADWFDYSNIYSSAKSIHDNGFAVCMGTAGDMDFINGISRARGMEEVLMDLVDNNEAFLEIMDARFKFYYDTQENILKESKGFIDFAHAGEDLGNQLGPMISMDIFNRHFTPKYEKYFKMAHSYGAKTMMHMCGTVWPFLDRLIEIGLDVYDVVQPTTPENDIDALARNFGDRIIFQGSMDVQKELAWGTAEEVRKEVRRRLKLFPEGGLILGPSHAVQPGSPIENIIAMYSEAGSLMDKIPEWVYKIEGQDSTELNMSKLF
ncbi:uroporphyrinogen decarboxylase family protein [Actinomycetota bacterium]